MDFKSVYSYLQGVPMFIMFKQSDKDFFDLIRRRRWWSSSLDHLIVWRNHDVQSLDFNHFCRRCRRRCCCWFVPSCYTIEFYQWWICTFDCTIDLHKLIEGTVGSIAPTCYTIEFYHFLHRCCCRFVPSCYTIEFYQWWICTYLLHDWVLPFSSPLFLPVCTSFKVTKKILLVAI